MTPSSALFSRLMLVLATFCSLVSGSLPPGYRPLKLNLHQAQPSFAVLLPDSEVVYSPTTVGFDASAYLQQSGGFLAQHLEYLRSEEWIPAVRVVDRIAQEYSLNPRLLLSLLEYECGCVMGPLLPGVDPDYLLNVVDGTHRYLYNQLDWAAQQLSQGYYGWRSGMIKEIPLPDGTSYSIPPEANPGSVALMVYYASRWSTLKTYADQSGRLTWQALHPQTVKDMARDGWEMALDPQKGLPALYGRMFGDPWERARLVEPLQPPGLRQPPLILPFEAGRLWSYSSGPHPVWRDVAALAALDFAPAAKETGCIPTKAWVTAVADGLVVRSDYGSVVQDLVENGSSDGLEQTGWVIFYMHIESRDRVAAGAFLKAGDLVGHPSCEGGFSTGTHLHIARKYNGEWIAAGGALPFELSGWKARAGDRPYEGTLVRGAVSVTAHPYGSYDTLIRRGRPIILPDQDQDR